MGKIQIPIVEDENALAGYILRALQDTGYAVLAPVSSAEAGYSKGGRG